MQIWITSDGRKVVLLKEYHGGFAWWGVLFEVGLDRYQTYCDIENEFNNIFTRRKKNAIATVKMLLAAYSGKG